MTQPLSLQGAFTALATPFTPDGSGVDLEALDRLVSFQIDSGIDGLVPCGTTGESPTLTEAEQREVIRRTVTAARGKVPVVAGAGSNSTVTSRRLAQAALEAGAQAVMLVMPYYNKPPQQGLIEHVLAVAQDLGGAPVVLYNIPGRSVVDLSLDSLCRIVDRAPNVVAVKDATGNVLRCQQTVGTLGDRVAVLCGDDALTVAMMACGAKGVISVSSNVVPAAVAAVCRAMREDLWQQTHRLQLDLLGVHEAMFAAPSPGPVKVALAHRGLLEPAVRLPMVAPSEEVRRRVVDAVSSYEAGSGR